MQTFQVATKIDKFRFLLWELSLLRLSKKPFQSLHLLLGDETPCRLQGEVNNTEE